MPVQQLQGPQGERGIQGSQGLQGSKGLQGEQGSQGLQGYDGAQGSQGIEGPQGIIGATGLQGFIGPQSLLTGVQGPQGAQGSQGIVGGAAAYYVTNNATYTFTGNNNYTALDGPSVTVNLTKTNALVLVFMNVGSGNYSAGYCYMSISLSGANTVAQTDANAAKYSAPTLTYGTPPSGGVGQRSICGMAVFTGLSTGNTTFNAQYKGNTNQSWSVSNRRIVVIPF